eukprot:g2712.t1
MIVFSFILLAITFNVCLGVGRSSCTDPGTPWHGERHLRLPTTGAIDDELGEPEEIEFRNGVKVHFTCSKDYVLHGTDTMTCDNGRWIGDIPQCRIKFDNAKDGLWDYTGVRTTSAGKVESLVKDSSWWLMDNEDGKQQKKKMGTRHEKTNHIAYGR